MYRVNALYVDGYIYGQQLNVTISNILSMRAAVVQPCNKMYAFGTDSYNHMQYSKWVNVIVMIMGRKI